MTATLKVFFTAKSGAILRVFLTANRSQGSGVYVTEQEVTEWYET
jgi:hypothetical protein